jgi:predicted amidohydrolase
LVQGLQQLAREHSIPINVGLHEPTSPPSNRITNTLVWINSSGTISHRYQKLHVFDIDLRPDGGPMLRESAAIEPGKELSSPYDMTDAGLGQIGSLICFDVRFPEPALSLRRKGATILLYPSAFTVPTGKLHWEALLRARAIENQCWVIAAAQCGRHNEKRASYGDSLVIDPNGKVIDRLERVEDLEAETEGTREPKLLVIDLDMGLVERVRKGIPLLRRDDVYGLV